MERIDKIKSIKSEVENMLYKSPASRDSDDKLVCNIWYNRIGKDKIEQMTAMELLTIISEGKLPSYDNISRARRKLQEDNVNLRGESYKERHNQEAGVRANISNI
jgi:hypothetical protein